MHSSEPISIPEDTKVCLPSHKSISAGFCSLGGTNAQEIDLDINNFAVDAVNVPRVILNMFHE